MKPKDEFQEIGKKLPYDVPTDFFDQFSEKALQRARQREQHHKKVVFLWRSLAVAAAFVAVAFLGFLIPDNGNSEGVLGFQKKQVEETVAPEQNKEITEQAIVVIEEVAKESTPEIASDEDVNDVLADLSDDELMQLAAMFKADPFIEEAHNN